MKHPLQHIEKEEIGDIQYYPISDHNYETLFRSIEHNGKTLSDYEKGEYLDIVNDTISQYSTGLPLIQESLDSCRDCHDEYHSIAYIVYSVMLFVLITSIDCMVAGKYFMLADTDYDKRFMRGKMMIILNEGFKKLYGFSAKERKKTEWGRLEPLMNHFPADIQRQYLELTQRLEAHSTSSSWWKDERNYETHLDAERLYASRMKDVIESKVMIDSLKLFNTLLAVYEFLTNMHACLRNYLVDIYNRGE